MWWYVSHSVSFLKYQCYNRPPGNTILYLPIPCSLASGLCQTHFFIEPVKCLKRSNSSQWKMQQSEIVWSGQANDLDCMPSVPRLLQAAPQADGSRWPIRALQPAGALQLGGALVCPTQYATLSLYIFLRQYKSLPHFKSYLNENIHQVHYVVFYSLKLYALATPLWWWSQFTTNTWNPVVRSN